MTDIVEHAKAALEGVTEGPWKAPATLLGAPCTTVFGNSHHVAYFHTGNRTNAEFIAQSRTLVPELVAEVERLRTELNRVAAQIKGFATLNVETGDETPYAKRAWHRIADEIAIEAPQ